MAGQQGRVDAEAWARGIEGMSRGFWEFYRTMMEQKYRKGELSLQAINRLDTFMKMPADKRQLLLQNPMFRQSLMSALDPDLFMNPRAVGKLKPEQIAQFTQSIQELGTETPEEKATRETLQAGAREKTAQAGTAETAEKVAAYKAEFQMNRRPLDIQAALTLFDEKDPFAASVYQIATASPEGAQLVSNMAKREKGAGPLWDRDRMMDLTKWATGLGLPLNVATQVAAAMTSGRYEDIPKTYTDLTSGKTVQVQTEIQRRLAIDAMNANSRAQEVRNTIQNSIANTQLDILKTDPFLTPEQALADASALRAGRPVPFALSNLQRTAQIDEMHKNLAAQELQQKIAMDKTGIPMIREGLMTMLQTYKDTTGLISGVSGAQQRDMQDKIGQMVENLTQRYASLYGVKYSPYEANHPIRMAVWGLTGDYIKGQMVNAMGAYDLTADGLKSLTNAFDAAAPVPGINPAALSIAPKFTGEVVKPTIEPLTDDQKVLLQKMLETTGKVLSTPGLPRPQLQKMQDYFDNMLTPIYKGTRPFNDLFTPPVQPGQEQQPGQE